MLEGVVVQVGGGAFAASVGAAFSASGTGAALHAVQTQGCAPLARAWERAGVLAGGRDVAARHWGECMWPWEHEPQSLADGIRRYAADPELCRTHGRHGRRRVMQLHDIRDSATAMAELFRGRIVRATQERKAA